MRIRVELTVPVESRISRTPRILVRVLVRAICFPAFRSLSFTFLLCPAGMLATPEAKRSRLCALAAGSSLSRNVRADTNKLTLMLHDVPESDSALHRMGTRHVVPLQPICGFWLKGVAIGGNVRIVGGMFPGGSGDGGSGGDGGGGGATSPSAASAWINPKPVPKSKPVSKPPVLGSSMSIAVAFNAA